MTELADIEELFGKFGSMTRWEVISDSPYEGKQRLPDISGKKLVKIIENAMKDPKWIDSITINLHCDEITKYTRIDKNT